MKYHDLINKVKETAIRLDMAVDKFPPDHPYRTNPRYSQAKLDTDVQNEEAHLSKLESIMETHKVHRDRLTKVEEELWNLQGGNEDLSVLLSPSRTLTQTATARQLRAAFSEVMDPSGMFGFGEGAGLLDPGHKVSTHQGQDGSMLEDVNKLVIPAVADVLPPAKNPKVTLCDDKRDSTVEKETAEPRTIVTVLKDKLFDVSACVETRRQEIARNLISLEEAMILGDGETMDVADWIKIELRRIEDKLLGLEKLETEVWDLTAKVTGVEARRIHCTSWKTWLSHMSDKMDTIKHEYWKFKRRAAPALPVLTPAAPTSVCSRTQGHLEKARLPNFSGRSEDYADFKSLFQQLCGGERYPSVIELTQLRQKIPKDAVQTIAGLTSPSEAWKRLDEIYGNRESAILSAIRKLRAFKPSKSADCDQVIEVARSVQRCQMVLEAVLAMDEFHSDRETVACVIDSLPATAQERWFHRGPAPTKTHVERSKALLVWLEEERRAAVSVHLHNLAKSHSAPQTMAPKVSNLLDSSLSTQVTTDQGLLSGAMHAAQEDSRAVAKLGIVGPVTTADSAREVMTGRLASLMERKLDGCPVCKERHYYEKTWAKVNPTMKTRMLSTHQSSCPKFATMSSEDKMKTVTAQGACLHCSAWDHNRHRGVGGASAGEPKCKFKNGAADCGGKHGLWYHGTASTLANTGSIVESCGHGCAKSSVRQPGMYEVHGVKMSAADGVDKAATVLVDPGSDTDYITHDFAASLGLVGTPYSCFFKVVDMDYIEKKTAKYDFDIMDRDGVAHRIHALGLDTVTTLPEEPDLAPIRHLLKGLPDEVVQRPQGKVDILLGLGSSSLHGRTRQEWGNLRLMESRFGCGWVIRGSHKLLKFPTIAMKPAMSVAAQAMSQAVEIPPSLYNVFHIASALTPGDEFSELNELGTSPAPVCRRCVGCKDCTFRRKRLSPEDQAVVARIEASMEVDEITGVIRGKYPWKPCVDRMCDNSRQAVAVQSSIEKHMLKTGTFSDYVEEMQKAIEEGKVRELSESEMSVWHGHVHYISTFAVVKPGSLSTCTRIVSNSAMRNAISKLSLNDCMYPGPNALADLLSCLLFWRGVEVAIMMDLRKAYQAIHTSDTELHLRRFFFLVIS